ncbi:hypothetical protein ABIA39_001777 [Nocardia sp. GAS34]
MRATARHLADNGRYVVLSTTLTSIMTGTYGVYSGSKAAVERMVLAAAKELGDRGITVNAVAPGPIDDDFFRGAETPESIAEAALHNPHGRLGLPTDTAPIVGWLISDEAGWVSGRDRASLRAIARVLGPKAKTTGVKSSPSGPPVAAKVVAVGVGYHRLRAVAAPRSSGNVMRSIRTRPIRPARSVSPFPGTAHIPRAWNRPPTRHRSIPWCRWPGPASPLASARPPARRNRLS